MPAYTREHLGRVGIDCRAGVGLGTMSPAPQSGLVFDNARVCRTGAPCRTIQRLVAPICRSKNHNVRQGINRSGHRLPAMTSPARNPVTDVDGLTGAARPARPGKDGSAGES